MAKKEERVKCIIQAGVEGEPGEVFVSVNGEPVLIKLGEEVELKPEYVEAIKNAVIETKDSKTGKTKFVKRFIVERV